MAAVAPESHLRENPFRLAQQQLHKVADTFGIDERLTNVLQECKKAVEVSIPTSLDDGSVRAFQGFRVTHNVSRGPVEGRHPLPPGRHARRGQGPRDVDDLEVLADGASVRWSEGRRALRPEADVARRARAHDPPVHLGDHQRDRPGEGHPGAGRRDERRDDGVDLRHVLDEQGSLGLGRRHRQAADDRRVARPRGGDRARGRLLSRIRPREAGPFDGRRQRRGPGLRQRRLVLRQAHRRARSHRRGHLGLERRCVQRARNRRCRGIRAQARAAARSPS